MRATTYPFLTVGLVNQGKFAPLAKIEGVLDTDTLMAQLIEIHENAEPQLVANRVEEYE